MRILLDTHMALWTVYQSARLPEQARTLLESPRTEACFSVVSLWEIAIKHMKYPGRLPSAVVARKDFLEAGMKEWPLCGDVFARLEALPPLHKDPFDRLLLAVAFTEPMYFLTVDHQMSGYDVERNILIMPSVPGHRDR